MKNERIGWIAANALLLATALLLAYLMSGCMTYSKALRKFGHLAKDSTTVLIQDTVTIPKDSIVTQFKTDTTIFHKVIETLRSKLTIDRTPRSTRITAECKPDTIIRTLQAKCPPVASFGIAPGYKWAFYITLGLLIVAIIVFLFSYLFKLTVVKR
ncbi:hypothetical protein [Spirosoma lituiforme]